MSTVDTDDAATTTNTTSSLLSKVQVPWSNTLSYGSTISLAKFFGRLNGKTHSGSNSTSNSSRITDEHLDDEEEGEDGDADVDVDEESLMWDAQAALIAHQHGLALETYTMAALPPHRSAQACLALGNLLIRGTSFSSAPTTPTEDGTVRRDSKSSQNESSPVDSLPSPTIAKAFASFFRSTLPSTPAGNDDKRPLTSPTYTKRFDVSSNNWAIRKEGKRAMRDVEGMGVAGGWLVLGIAYIAEGELQKQITRRKAQQAQALEFKKRSQAARPIPAANEGTGHIDGGDNDALVISFKPRSTVPVASSEEQTPTPNRARHFGSSTGPSSESASVHSSTSASTVTLSQDRPKSQTGTEDTVESAELPTPGGFIVTADGVKVERKSAPASIDTLKLILELLQPLLHLYRHGHIQACDPVYLPPITSSQLPSILKVTGDHNKRRNVWDLGGVVASKLGEIDLIRDSTDDPLLYSQSKSSKDVCRLQGGIRVLRSYLLGMTAPAHAREGHFRAILSVGHTGIPAADELVRQAGQRLDIIARTPSQSPLALRSPTQDGYPFPVLPSTRTKTPPGFRSSGTHMTRKSSNLSMLQVPPRRSASRSSSISRSAGSPSSSKPSHNRGPSTSSVTSLYRGANSLVLKSVHSTASLSLDTMPMDSPSANTKPSPPRQGSAVDTLRRISQDHQARLRAGSPEEADAQWPDISAWKIGQPSPPVSPPIERPYSIEAAMSKTARTGSTEISPKKPRRNIDKQLAALRPVASSPNITDRRTGSIGGNSLLRSSKPSSASLLCASQQDISCTIDPALAAAELASTLTKHVACSVCGAKGVNFPECRKCGMRFCSRDCRVGEKGAGNGKRHICGSVDGRKNKMSLSTITEPVVTPPSSTTPTMPVAAF